MNAKTLEIIDEVSALIRTRPVKDYTYLSDWIDEGGLDGMTPEQLAAAWDALPEMETDDNTPTR